MIDSRTLKRNKHFLLKFFILKEIHFFHHLDIAKSTPLPKTSRIHMPIDTNSFVNYHKMCCTNTLWLSYGSLWSSELLCRVSELLSCLYTMLSEFSDSSKYFWPGNYSIWTLNLFFLSTYLVLLAHGVEYCYSFKLLGIAFLLVS